MSSTAIAIAQPPSAPTVTADQLELIKHTVAQGATAQELSLFLYDCARRGVHPLDKLLHFSKRGGKYVPITSIDFMRSRAAQTGDYGGQDDAVFAGLPKTAEFSATVRIYRFVHGQLCSFTATARWPEYKPEQHAFMWERMPHTMLSKCAEALALRKGFPQELAGLYESAELDQAETREPDAVDADTGELVEEVPRLITPAQRKRLFALASKHGWSTDAIKAVLLERFNLSSTSLIPILQYDQVCAAFSVPPPTADPDEQPF
jgi:phage recombination protein Bet